MASNKSIAKFTGYIAMAIAACVLLLNNVLGPLGVSLGSIGNILSIVERVCTYIAIALVAYDYAASKGGLIKTLYWVFLIVLIAAYVFGLLKG